MALYKSFPCGPETFFCPRRHALEGDGRFGFATLFYGVFASEIVQKIAIGVWPIVDQADGVEVFEALIGSFGISFC